MMPPQTSTDFAKLSWDEILPIYNDLYYRPLTLDNASGWLKEWSEFEDILGEAREQVYFDYTCETGDAVKEANNLRFQTEIEPNAAEQRVRLSRRLLEIGYTEPGLEESLRRFRTTNEVFREENVPLKAEVERINAEYQKVTGAMTADWDGEELPLPRLRPFMLDPDRQVREKAWRLHRKPYVDARDQLAVLFSEQYAIRQQIAHNAGFKDFRDYTHIEKHRFDVRSWLDHGGVGLLRLASHRPAEIERRAIRSGSELAVESDVNARETRDRMGELGTHTEGIRFKAVES